MARVDVLDVAVPLALAQEVFANAILPGSVWRNLGSHGHPRGVEVTVEALTSGGRVRFTKNTPGRQANGERRYTMDEPAFRACHVLVKQPATRQAKRALVQGIAATVVGKGLVDDGRLDKERCVNEIVQSLTPMTPPRAPTPEAPEGAPPPEEPASPGASPEAVPPPATPEEEDDPLDAFVAHGRATLERLDRTLTRTEEDREIARLELEELDLRLGVLRTKRDKINDAIRAALAVAEGATLFSVGPREPAFAPPPEPEPEPSTEVVPVDPLFARAIIEDTPPPRLGRPPKSSPQARPQYLPWLRETLSTWPPDRQITSTTLLDEFVARFPVWTDRTAARDRLTIMLVEQSGPRAKGTKLQRIGHGAYVVVPDAPPAEPEPEGPEAVDDAPIVLSTEQVIALGGDPAEATETTDPFTPEAVADTGFAPITRPEPEAVDTPVSQRRWVMDRFAEQKLWTVRALVDAWVETNGGERETVRASISKAISERMKGEIKFGPQLIRVSQGLYEAVG